MYKLTIDCYNIAENDNKHDIIKIASMDCGYIAGYINVPKDNHDELLNNSNISSILQDSYYFGDDDTKKPILTNGTSSNLLVWSSNFNKIEEIVPKYINDDKGNRNNDTHLGIRSTNFVKLQFLDTDLIYTCIVVHGNDEKDKRTKLLKSIFLQSMGSNSIVNPIIIGDFNCEFYEIYDILTEIEKETKLPRKFNIDFLSDNSENITYSNKYTRNKKELVEARFDWILFPIKLPDPYKYEIVEKLAGDIHGKYDHKRVKNFVKITNSNEIVSDNKSISNLVKATKTAINNMQKIKCEPV